MKTKKVFDVGVWLTSIIECRGTTNPVKMKQDILHMLETWSWIWKCQGKTKTECSRKGYIIFDKWMKEVNNNE